MQWWRIDVNYLLNLTPQPSLIKINIYERLNMKIKHPVKKKQLLVVRKNQNKLNTFFEIK